MNKRIILNNGNVILIDIRPDYCYNTVSISESYLCDGVVSKSLELCIWDDMSFNAYVFDDSVTGVEFDFDINHPLYFCVKKLLGDDLELVIDDDATANKLEKYVIIKKENNLFKFIFINNCTIQTFNSYKFGAFIKNIGPDCRSKITDDSIKGRLVEFFRVVEQTLLEEYHQITFDEYIDVLDVKTKKLQRKI